MFNTAELLLQCPRERWALLICLKNFFPYLTLFTVLQEKENITLAANKGKETTTLER
jgi:hypothetical protein